MPLLGYVYADKVFKIHSMAWLPSIHGIYLFVMQITHFGSFFPLWCLASSLVL